MSFQSVTSAGAPATITIVVVAWGSVEEVVACISSLAEARTLVPAGRLLLELVVVDNGGDAPTSALSPWPDAKLIRNEENRGFAAAANQGVAAGHGEFVLFLNPDIRAVGEPFSPLIEGFAAHPAAVALAPMLVETDDTDRRAQHAFQLRRLPTWAGSLRDLFLIDELVPGSPWHRRERYLDQDRSQPFPVEQAAAAALVVRRDVLRTVGGFDESFFPAWFEDVDLCRRLHPHGEIFYWPRSIFAHRGGTSAERLGFEVFLPTFYGNAHRYWCKHRGRANAVALRVALAAGMTLRLLLLPFASGARRRSTAARAYARVLRAALGLDRSFRIPTEDWARWRQEAACRP